MEYGEIPRDNSTTAQNDERKENSNRTIKKNNLRVRFKRNAAVFLTNRVTSTHAHKLEIASDRSSTMTMDSTPSGSLPLRLLLLKALLHVALFDVFVHSLVDGRYSSSSSSSSLPRRSSSFSSAVRRPDYGVKGGYRNSFAPPSRRDSNDAHGSGAAAFGDAASSAHGTLAHSPTVHRNVQVRSAPLYLSAFAPPSRYSLTSEIAPDTFSPFFRPSASFSSSSSTSRWSPTRRSIACYVCNATLPCSSAIDPCGTATCRDGSSGEGGGGDGSASGGIIIGRAEERTPSEGPRRNTGNCESGTCFITVSLEDPQSVVHRGCAKVGTTTTTTTEAEIPPPLPLPPTSTASTVCQRRGSEVWCFCNGGDLCNGGSVFDMLAESDECADNPCKNGGICTDGLAEFECTCPEGFVGKDCGVFDGCADSPCLNAATCVNLDTQEFVCECSPGFVGRFCEIEVNECASTPCKNGATCVDNVNGYICVCTGNYTGRHCETPEDACTSSPCSNGGTCRSMNIAGGENGFVCDCVVGYGGRRCRDVTDFCVFEPCRNGGSCRGFGGPNYICECLAGFMGKNCEVSLVDPCQPNPCANGGSCIHSPGGEFECRCTELWSGRRCEKSFYSPPKPNPCIPNPCANNGRCREKDDGGFECICLHGFVGDTCSEKDACQPNPCVNGGICKVNDATRFTCECPSSYSGRLCQDRLSPCDPNPCQNQGACIPDMTKLDNLFCTCLPGYTGRLCETLVPRCNDNPCQNGGTCRELGAGRFECRCKPGFEGPTCGIQPSPCLPNPCLNDGRCIVRATGVDFNCKCKAGFGGIRCELVTPQACSTRPCLNGGTCIPMPFNTFKCACKSRFTGKTCTTRLGCSAGHKCLNGATCIDEEFGDTGYSCKCPENFEGTYCEVPKMSTFTCIMRQDGIYSSPQDPCTSTYFVCSMGKMFTMACPPQTVFNPSNNICDWPHRINCKEREGGGSGYVRA